MVIVSSLPAGLNILVESGRLTVLVEPGGLNIIVESEEMTILVESLGLGSPSDKLGLLGICTCAAVQAPLALSILGQVLSLQLPCLC